MTDQGHDERRDRSAPTKNRGPNGELRALMEKALKENHKLREAVVEQTTRQRRHVTADDFADLVGNGDAWHELDVESITARADELEAQRTESSRTVLRNALLSQGVAEDGVDDALTRLLAGPGAAEPVAPPPETAQSRTAMLGGLGGRPAQLGGADYGSKLGADRGLWGADLIKASLQRDDDS